jgi:uncharacterized damage-inducible protein DinB
MITPKHVRQMARYNQWMNEKIFAACEKLRDAERKTDRGANYRSIHSTLNYVLWADYVWIGRFTKDTPLGKEYPKGPIGVDLYTEWDDLKSARLAMDRDIVAWGSEVGAEWLASDYSWFSLLTNTTMTKPAWFLVDHLFNHQTDHRGQATTLLVQQGVSPGESDLMLMPLEQFE